MQEGHQNCSAALQMLSLHGKSFCKMLFSNNFFRFSYVSSGSQGSGGLHKGLMLLRDSWRYVKNEGLCLLRELLIHLAFQTPCNPKGSSLNNIVGI